MPVPRQRHRRNGHLAGDLLEIEGWYYIDDHQVCVDFDVTWRHPEHGISGVYRPGGCGFEASCDFGTGHLAFLVESTVYDDARVDFAHDGAFFARDLRIAPVRDTTDAETYAALRAGPPYPRQCGRIFHPAPSPDVDIAPGWRRVLLPLSEGSGGEAILAIRDSDPLPPGWHEFG